MIYVSRQNNIETTSILESEKMEEKTIIKGTTKLFHFPNINDNSIKTLFIFGYSDDCIDYSEIERVLNCFIKKEDVEILLDTDKIKNIGSNKDKKRITIYDNKIKPITILPTILNKKDTKIDNITKDKINDIDNYNNRLDIAHILNSDYGTIVLFRPIDIASELVILLKKINPEYNYKEYDQYIPTEFIKF